MILKILTPKKPTAKNIQLKEIATHLREENKSVSGNAAAVKIIYHDTYQHKVLTANPHHHEPVSASTTTSINIRIIKQKKYRRHR